MAQSQLDLILRTRKEGSGEQEATKGLQGLGGAFEELTGMSLGTTAALGALVGALKFAVESAMEAEKIQAQLGAVIKSTGGAAGLTVDDINDMAGALSEMSAVEDDAIAKASAVMLTFTKIGEEIFPSAMEAALNVSAALGQDLQSSVVQLGKALNDPIQGITALTRVGVSFTREQKDLIASLVESGDVMEAQKVILQELEVEFGGAAEAIGNTAAGKIDKAKNSLGNLAETIGEKLLPSIGSAADGLTWLLTVMDKITDAMADTAEKASDAGLTYEEYTEVVLDAAVAAGRLGKAEAESWKAAEKTNDVIELLASKNVPLLTEAEYKLLGIVSQNVEEQGFLRNAISETGDAAQDTAGQVDGLAESEQAAADQAAALREQQSLLKSELNDLKTVIGGPLRDENEKFIEQQQRLKDEAGNLADKIAELEGKKYLTDAQKTELADLKTAYDDAITKIGEEQRAHEARTKAIVFDLAVQRAAMDGLTSAELEVLGRLAKEWGLVDEATATAIGNLDTAFAELATNEDVDAAFRKIVGIKNAALGIPSNISVNINVTQTGTTNVGANNGNNRGPGPAFADGVENFVVPPGYPDDTFRMNVSSGEVVNVTPNGKGGGGDQFYITINNPNGDSRGLMDEVEMLKTKYGAR